MEEFSYQAALADARLPADHGDRSVATFERGHQVGETAQAVEPADHPGRQTGPPTVHAGHASAVTGRAWVGWAHTGMGVQTRRRRRRTNRRRRVLVPVRVMAAELRSATTNLARA